MADNNTLFEMRAYYENHDSPKDIDIFNAMIDKFGVSLITLKRHKKNYGWINKEKTKEESDVVYPTQKKLKTSSKKSIKPEKEKKKRSGFVPDQGRVDIIKRTGNKSKDSKQNIRIDIMSEMILQGARPIDIRHFVRGQQTKLVIGEDNVWIDYNFNEFFERDLKEVKQRMMSEYKLDIEFEEAIYMHRNNFLFGKAFKEGAYLAAQKIENDRIAHIEKFRGTALVDRLKRIQNELSLSEDDIIKIIEDAKRRHTEALPE